VLQAPFSVENVVARSSSSTAAAVTPGSVDVLGTSPTGESIIPATGRDASWWLPVALAGLAIALLALRRRA